MLSRASALKRPLPSRSFWMTAATSSPPSDWAAVNGTIAIGTGSRTPEVTSISSAACALGTVRISAAKLSDSSDKREILACIGI